VPPRSRALDAARLGHLCTTQSARFSSFPDFVVSYFQRFRRLKLQYEHYDNSRRRPTTRAVKLSPDFYLMPLILLARRRPTAEICALPTQAHDYYNVMLIILSRYHQSRPNAEFRIRLRAQFNFDDQPYWISVIGRPRRTLFAASAARLPRFTDGRIPCRDSLIKSAR